MGLVRVAAVQLEADDDIAGNLARCLRLIDDAAGQGAQLIVLPEFCNHLSWYTDRAHAHELATRPGDPFLSAIAQAAARHRVHIKINVTHAYDDGRTGGTNFLFAPDGSVLGSCDKQTLMGAENDHLDPAVEVGPVIDTPFGRIGMYACMEGVLNEVARGLALRGAQVLLNSLNSFATDEASLHIPVRAAENKVWVVAANKVGPLLPAEQLPRISAALGVPAQWLHGAGESQIVAPDGTVVARGPRTGEAVVIADIDVSLADDKRRPDGSDLLASRRPELYGPIAAQPRGRQRGPGASELPVAVVRTELGGDPVPAVARAVAQGAMLIVLPELAFGAADEATAAARLREALSVPTPTGAILDTGAHAVVTTVADGDHHVGILVSADGVIGRQPQLHRPDRHPTNPTATNADAAPDDLPAETTATTADTAPDGQTAGMTAAIAGVAADVLPDGLVTFDLPWGRLAIIVGTDTIYPELFRMAALSDVDVVAAPCAPQEGWELSLGLPERSAENRLNVIAATPLGEPAAIFGLTGDFTLWTAWEGPFTGRISHPIITDVKPDEPIGHAVIAPAQAANRLVSRQTDLVDGRPWRLVQALTER